MPGPRLSRSLFSGDPRLTGGLCQAVVPRPPADLKTLDMALTTIANDLAAGKDITSDLTTARQDEFKLVGDLAGHIPAAARATLLDLAFDLTGLSIGLGALKG